MAKVSDRVRRLRKEHALTQEEVARRAGLTLNSYGDIERGHVRDPHLSSLEAIAQALGVSVQELLAEDKEPELVGPKAKAPRRTGPPRVSKERLEEHFEDVRQNEVDYLNRMIEDFWRLALPDEKPRAHFVPEDIDTDRVGQFLEHALDAGNVFEPEEAERIKQQLEVAKRDKKISELEEENARLRAAALKTTDLATAVARTREIMAREWKSNLPPPHLLRELEDAEERFIIGGVLQLWEAVEEADAEHPVPPDERTSKREAKREELRPLLRSGPAGAKAN